MLLYRNYRPRDFADCVEICAEAWPIFSEAVKTDTYEDLVSLYTEMSLSFSDYAAVCCDGEKTVGFIFAGTREKEKTRAEKRKRRAMLKGYFTGKYGSLRKPVLFLLSFIATFLTAGFYCRHFYAEIELLAVKKDYQKKGIASKLIQDLISHITMKKGDSLCLFTDVESNWKFYENYGFTKYRELNDYFLRFLRKEKVKSFIYTLNIGS